MIPANVSLTAPAIGSLLSCRRDDHRGTYRTWFLWEQRLKNFRSIRRDLQAIVLEIEAETFGTTYRGSSLKTVDSAIAEQRQIFKGADHAFLWKPKLRIPDIYENPEHQRALMHGHNWRVPHFAGSPIWVCASSPTSTWPHIGSVSVASVRECGRSMPLPVRCASEDATEDENR